MAAILNRIAQTAQRIDSATTTALPSSRLRPESQPCRPLQHVDIGLMLPPPTPILDSLLALGVDKSRAEQASQSFLDHALKCRTLFISKHAQMTSQLLKVPSSSDGTTALANTIRQLYLRRLKEMSEGCLSSARQWTNTTQPRPDDRRKLTPPSKALLEYFFSKKPVPTGAEKDFLADKLNVTRHQIDIWFQNKRRRSRVGYDSAGNPIYEQIEIPPLDLAASAALFKPSSCSQPERLDTPGDIELRHNTTTPSSSSDCTNMNPLEGLLSLDEHRIPISDSFKFVECWMRRPATSVPTQSTLPIDDLTKQFAAWSIADNDDVPDSCSPQTTPFTIYTYHTAIRQTPSAFKLRRIRRLPTVRAPSECVQSVFAEPIPAMRNSLSKPNPHSSLGKRKLPIGEVTGNDHCVATPVSSCDTSCTLYDSYPSPAATDIAEPTQKRARLANSRWTATTSHSPSASPAPLASEPVLTLSRNPGTPQTSARKIAPLPRRTPTTKDSHKERSSRRPSTSSVTSEDSFVSSLYPPTPRSPALVLRREPSDVSFTPRAGSFDNSNWAILFDTPVSQLDLLATVAGSSLAKQLFNSAHISISNGIQVTR